jgi:hypothetical protein
MGRLMTLMANRISLLVVGLSLALAPSAAHAATPGVHHGTMMVSAERLFGLSVGRVTTGNNNAQTSDDQTHFGLFLAPTTAAWNPYMVPRLAFDLAPIDGLTVGGSLGFVVSDLENSQSVTAFLLAPRVGYILGLGHLVSLWLRGGIPYFNISTHADTGAVTKTSDTVWGLGLDLEPTLLVSPWEHVGFTAGLLVDLPMTGKGSHETTNTVTSVTTSTSVDTTVRHIGLLLGMVATF